MADVWTQYKKPPPHPLRCAQEMKEIERKGSVRKHESTSEAQQAAWRLNPAP